MTDESVKEVDLYVATGRDKHGAAVEAIGEPPPPDASPKEAMRHKLQTAAGRAVYKMRKAIVEPVYPQNEGSCCPLQCQLPTGDPRGCRCKPN